MEDQSQTLYTETIHHFLTVYRYLRRSSRQLGQAGIGGRKIAALRYLLEAGPCTVGQLRRYLYISSSSTSELIARLEAKQLVTRARSARDNRVVIVSLTEAGREAAQRTSLQGVPLLRERLKDLPLERLARLHEAMADIVELLDGECE
jgi:DNA-binding MarR family transcriptional regulator